LKDYAGCPDPEATGNGEIDFVCAFSVFLEGFGLQGLPTPAANATVGKDLNVGVTTSVKVYRLDDIKDCTSAPFVAKKGGVNFEATSDEGFTWKGNFLMFRPPGQLSMDPGGFDTDGEGGFFLMNGALTFKDSNFTIVEYKGKTPVDICDLLA
jgi:hypothetical protein